ncbi:hypothetical protein GON01_04840 [Sphingomonas sp. MAH-20]|uniref:Uncharacterized protein n=1 Tax=Sphingomonas horti TaxID=2682842 RepID=A0A6I4IYW8_9SPHN|nr:MULTISPECIES: hypothetical protein [Sphingomonas]MBA2918299.1 hypothetical protein [Sphingomonas sp. CGMCC 1.13658]MVO77266.1 hypothetical protein [Sphingomonas horti]
MRRVPAFGPRTPGLPELVEGLFFFFFFFFFFFVQQRKEVKGFDRLSQAGISL